MNDLYQEIILDHFKSPHNVGVFDSYDGIAFAKETNVGCGDEFSVALQLTKVGDVIEDVRWQGQGCAISTSALSVLSDYVKGKSVKEIEVLQKADVLELLGLDEINPGREKCVTLGLRAIQRALKKE